MDFSDTPQISKQAFTNPGTPPIRELPSIKNLLGVTTAVPQNVQTTTASTMPAAPAATDTRAEQPTPTEMSSSDNVATQDPEDIPLTTDQVPETQSAEDFATCWTQLFTELFTNDALIYHSLKGEIPDFENDTITITVKNGIQQDEFESRKKAILEYWRNHFSINVDDISIIVNEHKETKEVIINSEDRMRHMMKQNKNLAEFLNILDFKIKE